LDLQVLHTMNFGFPPISSGVFVQFSQRIRGLSRLLDNVFAQPSAMLPSAFKRSVAWSMPGLPKDKSCMMDIKVWTTK
jgi:hypothetical protein